MLHNCLVPSVVRVAAMLFVNAKGELLLQLRDDKPEIRFPNHWGVIGGHVEDGETFEDCLVREVSEEIELDARAYEYWDTHESAGYSIAMFAARLDEPAEFGAVIVRSCILQLSGPTLLPATVCLGGRN